MCMGGGGMGFEVESISVESSKTALTDNRDALMLSTATESLETRPERLWAKSQSAISHFLLCIPHPQSQNRAFAD